MTGFADLVDTSRRVASTPARNAKIAAMAAFLRKLARDEIPIAVAYLSGETRQGRFGIGYALLRDAVPPSEVAESTLSLRDVDALLAEIAATKGAGSKTRRASSLSALLGRATRDERDFLFRLIQGELRQGALESLMIDAVAAAADLPVATVHRAAMLAHGVVAVA